MLRAQSVYCQIKRNSDEVLKDNSAIFIIIYNESRLCFPGTQGGTNSNENNIHRLKKKLYRYRPRKMGNPSCHSSVSDEPTENYHRPLSSSLQNRAFQLIVWLTHCKLFG